MQFNPHRPELLASAGGKGELYITDLNNPENPFRVGAAAGRADDLESIDWNKKVPHILVTGSAGGFVTVWDIKAKKESLILNNFGRKPVSAIAWNPDVPTKLATAIPLDQDPLILLWDLRNSSQPERILKGHDQGILSLSWCEADSDLLLSSGKDNRNICWNPHTGQILGEFPIVLNATFQTRWCPRQPNLLATASFDNKIRIETLQNTNAAVLTDSTGVAHQAVDADDFFATAQTQPQTSSFNLQAPPKWTKRPVGVSFGFGGRIVTFHTAEPQKSQVKLGTFVSDSSVESSIADFQKALQTDDISAICDSRIEIAASEAIKEDWKAIRTLLADDPRKRILTNLGFYPAAVEKGQNGVNDELGHRNASETEGDFSQNQENQLSQFFSDDNSNFMTNLASSKGVKTNNPFHILKGDESDADKQITQSLTLGSFEEALDRCLQEKRMSDAFMIAICGGQKCIDKAQAAYFSQQLNSPNYVRLLASVVGKNLWDVVHNADIGNWKATMAILCTYANVEEFPDLCEALGDRLEESELTRENSSFCYLAGSKLEKVVPIWAKELQEREAARISEAGDESAFSIHVHSLQTFIEKVSVFRKAANYKDQAAQDDDSTYRLETLYNKYAEYADVVASHGHLDLAEEYMNLLPEQYPAAASAKTRIQQALNKKPVVGARTSSRGDADAPTAPVAPFPGAPATTPAPSMRPPVPPVSAYAPSNSYAAPSQTASTYTLSAPTNAYAPNGPYPASTPYQVSGSSIIPPSSATATPPPRPGADKGPNWNDLPDGVTRQSRSGRATPSATVASPYTNPSNPYAHPVASSPYSHPPQTTPTPLPPPPRAGQGPARTLSPSSTPPVSNMQPPLRPSPSLANAYTPALSSNAVTAQAPSFPQRSASPYNPPPAGAPPSNRYAPAPAAAPGGPTGVHPPPTGTTSRPPVAPNPYVSQNQHVPTHTPQSQTPHPGPAPPPPTGGPPRGFTSSRSPTGPPPPPTVRQEPPTSATPSTLTAARYPPGDRSHIATEAQPIFDVLHPEMQRIKGRAPANFKPQVDDTEKRLNLLFDGLNNDAVPQQVVAQLCELASAIHNRNFDQAQSINTELMKAMEGSGAWMVSLQWQTYRMLSPNIG